MFSKNLKKDLLFLVCLVFVGIVSRLIPHPWNFTAIGTMALFSGFSFRTNKMFMLIPIVSLLVSDLIIGFYDGMLYTYFGFAIGMGLSLVYFIKSSPGSLVIRALTLSGLSVVSSFLFFLVTNFGVWIGSTFYSQNLTGLMSSYIAGLPFLSNQIAGDLVYGAIIFGIYELSNAPVRHRQPIA